jgi:signal transduction histidine kinase
MRDTPAAARGTAAERGEVDDVLAGGIHETRRPLALARGYLQMLTDGSLGELNDGQRRAAERIEEKLLEAQEQLEHLEVLSRLGVAHTELGPVVLEDAVRAAVARAQAKADIRHGSIELRGRSDVRGVADGALLERILDNLLDNALTYSPGPPEIVAEIGMDGSPYIRVQDCGGGISPEVAPHIFSKWFRGDAVDTSRPGSGLGLYLSRQAAQQMDAALDLEWTKPGVGTSFRLSLATPAGR